MARNPAIEKMLHERQTVKSYDQTKRISKEDWEQITDVIQWAPTSFGAEPYSVLVINHDKTDVRLAIQKLMWGQGTVVEADKLVFFLSYNGDYLSNKDFWVQRQMRSLVEIKGKTKEEAAPEASATADKILEHFDEGKISFGDWADKQAYIALGAAMNAAILLGVGSTPMEGFEGGPLGKLLQEHKLMSDKKHVAVVVAFGYVKDAKSYAHWGTGKRVRVAKELKFNEI